MRKWLTAAIVVPVAAILLILALANRMPVVLSLDPFSPGSSGWSVELPLFLVILVAIMIGVVIGSVSDWIAQSRYRREARLGRTEVRRLEQEAAALRRSQQPPQPVPSGLPAVSYRDAGSLPPP